ncbi:hypothetical protein F383_39294 [Gossypium arboreum]|uniref:Uncharacterized protein n=1 Tax=Gossypium arboreum TaxID=29729 RepID=A0A0B0MQB8_GOSAR|nr:hypothetical protein F383_39294 [Gossypium arboreum]
MPSGLSPNISLAQNAFES